MKLKTAAGIALVAGVLGMAGTASAYHGESGREVNSIRLGGSGVSVSLSVGSTRVAHWLGTLTIDGCQFMIYECEDVEREIVRAFRREGYSASEWRGVITVDYGRRAPRLRWHSHDYDLIVEDDDCGELSICLHECHIHEGTAIGSGGRGRIVRDRLVDRRDWDENRRDWDHDRGDRDDDRRREAREREDDRRREAQERDDERRREAQERDDERRREAQERDDERRREARARDDERRREAREREDRGRRVERAEPRVSPQPYRPATPVRPKIVGAWVPEAP